MRKIRYGVAMSLDGYIAGPNGEADWVLVDSEFNFAELWAQFDTLLRSRNCKTRRSVLRGKEDVRRLTNAETGRPPECDHPPRVEPRLAEGITRGKRQRHLANGRRRTLSPSAGDGSSGHGRSKRHTDIAGRRSSTPSPSRTANKADLVQPQNLSLRTGLFDLRCPALTQPGNTCRVRYARSTPDPSPGHNDKHRWSFPEPRYKDS